MNNYNLVIDVGSSNCSFYKLGLGLVLREPTIIAKAEIGGKLQTVAVGDDANKLIKHNEKVEIIEPISHSVIKDRELTSSLLEDFLKKIGDKKFFNRNKLVYVVPSSLSENERNKCRNLAYSLNVYKTTLVSSAVLAYICSSVDDSIKTKLIIDIGGGTTDIALVFNMKVLAGITLGIGGKDIDQEIADYLLNQFNLVINKVELENIKKEIGTLLPNDIISYELTGFDFFSGIQKTIRLTSTEILPIMEKFFGQVYEVAEKLKSSCKGEAKTNLQMGGVFVCGGLANITGVERFFKSRLNLKVVVPQDPENAIMKGADILLKSAVLQERVCEEI